MQVCASTALEERKRKIRRGSIIIVDVGCSVSVLGLLGGERERDGVVWVCEGEREGRSELRRDDPGRHFAPRWG